MSSVKEEVPYNEIYDFNFRLISEDLDSIEDHLSYFIDKDVAFIESDHEQQVLDRFNNIQRLFCQLMGKNEISGYEQMDSYDINEEPNDVARMILREENKVMESLIKKETFSPAKVKALDILSEFFEDGELEIFQTQEDYNVISEESIEQLRIELNALPVSLADIVNQERRVNN